MAQRLAGVRERIRQAAARAGRDPAAVTVVGVCKGFGLDVVREAVEAGLGHLGENRVQEAEGKIPALEAAVTWHMVGHLQRNKVPRAVELFHQIDSLDSLRLAREIQRRAGRPVPVLVQVNVSGEETKHGFAPERLRRELAALRELENLRIRGLMTLAPLVEDAEQTRPVFRRLRLLAEELRQETGLPWETLSMGMSNDFEVAVEEGSTMVRLGTALFGPRPRA